MLYSGKLIKSIREFHNLNLDKLAYGLCSYSQLGRIERGERRAEKLLFESLYQRMGKYSGRFEEFLDCEPYEALEERWCIQDLIDSGQYSEALSCITSYKKSNKNRLHKQLMCLYECEIMHKTGVELEKRKNTLLEGIYYTLPDFRFEDIEKFYLSRTELYLIQMYVRYTELCGEKQNAADYYKRILAILDDDRYDRLEKGMHYRQIGYWLAEYYISNSRYKDALCIAEKAYDMTVKCDYIVLLCELKECILICREKLFAGQSAKYMNEIQYERNKLNHFKDFCLEYGVRTAEEFFPRYIESRVYNVNDIINQRRKALGITQEKLAGDEICDPSTISRLENKKHSLQKRTKTALLKEIGMSGDDYIACVDTYNYKVFEELNKINDAIKSGNPIKIKPIIDNIESEYNINTINSKQYIFSVYAKTTAMTNKCSYSAEQLKSVLSKSLGDIDKINLSNVFLTENEWTLLDNIIYMHKKAHEYNQCEKYLQPVSETYSNNHLHNNEFRFISVCDSCGDVYGEMGLIEKANRYSMEGLHTSVKNDILSFIPGNMYNCAWNILEKKHNISKKEINFCQRILIYAYVVYDVYDNEQMKLKIKNMCQRHNILFGIE